MIEEDPATRALQERSPEILLAGLKALVTDADEQDDRDLQMAMAVYHDCARRLGLDVAAVFDEAAAAAPPSVRELVAGFGRRTDVSPTTFHYNVEERGGRPRYVPWEPPPPSAAEVEELVRGLGVDLPPDWRSRFPPDWFSDERT